MEPDSEISPDIFSCQKGNENQLQYMEDLSGKG